MSATHPDRVFINSSDDINQPTSTTWNDFTVSLPSGILNAKSCMPLRLTVPNVSGTAVIPDYELVFWYESSTNGVVWTLHNVRLHPSYFNPTAGYTTYVKNQYFTSPADLVASLNVASTAGGDLLANNPYWVSGDITFSYNADTKKISFQGNTVSTYYRNCGYTNPAIATAIATNTIVFPSLGQTGNTVQPLIVGFNLNLRLGFAMSGYSLWTGLNNLVVGGTAPTNASLLTANQTNLPSATDVNIEADTFPNLVYTQNLFVRCDFLETSTLSSGGQRNILMVIPVNAPPLGVINYSAPPLFNFLYHINSSISAIRISIFDDANQPFMLPDSANVNLEMGFRYTL